MIYISSLLSFAFFLVALISVLLGAYVIKLNPKRKVNRAFLLLCISLSIWSLGFALGNSAQDLNTSLFWRRIAAIGWTSIVSLTLHFLLLITRERIDKTKEKTLYLLHIPALINMYIFSFSNKISMGQYNLVKNNYGWVNITVNNGWDYFYYIYYLIYMVLGLVALWKWKQRLEDKNKIRQVRLILGSLLVALVLGSITDTIMSTILKAPLPQMAPIFILIPAWAMYYSARYHDMINYEDSYIKDIIATEEDKKRIFHNIAIGFCMGGVLSFIFEYTQFIRNNEKNLKSVIIKSTMFIVIGTFIYLIQKIKDNRLKEKLTILILVANIPLITFYFLDYLAVTVWMFPIIIMISSLVFSNRKLLIATTVVSIITQRLIWILKPEGLVVVDEYDYILRIILFITAFIISFYVNKVYVGKTKENDYQIEFQKINSEVSSSFVTINQENFDERVNNLLAKIGSFFAADRAYLFLIDYENNTMTYSHEWCNEGIKDVGSIKEMPLTDVPWWIDELEKSRFIHVEDTDNLPDEAINEKAQFKKQNVKSLISVPVGGIGENGKIQGFISVKSVSSFKSWTSGDIELLRTLSNLLSDGLTKMKSEKEIEFMAYYDNLTELPNRFLFKDRVKSAISLAERNEKFISVMFIDLDNFKSVNDTMGHDGGDYLLKQVGDALTKKVRKSDTVARFGGDEFMIMLNNIGNYNDISKIANNIMDIFSRPFIIDDQEFFITGSGGIATFPVDGQDSETLVKNADTAMYEAKAKGKNQYSLCTTEMKDEVERNMKLSNDLYRALERNELIVYYQPQVDLINKEITGVEALLRWKHSEFGMISPGVFIPLAEKNGLINIIGEWVLETACTQNKKWQDMGLANLRMGVNLSGIQFINVHIADDVERILKKTDLDPKYLELEITESIAIKETDFVVDVLNKLKKIGVSIAIDDFGTEYSSLSRLKMLPIDRIKIDMEFIKGIEKNEKDKAITVVIINLAKSLGLNVLAEGVETGSQLEFLNQKMCDFVQGYYYYKPMPAQEMERILQKPFERTV